MTELKLDVEIINKEKREVSVEHKTTLFSILGGLWVFLLYTQPLDENSIYKRLGIWLGFPFILFCILLLSSVFVIMYVFFMVPSKGGIILTVEGISLKIKKNITVLRLKDFSFVRFYAYKADNDGTTVYLEFKTENISFANEINVVFMNERATLYDIVGEWKKQGLDVEIITTPPNTVYEKTSSYMQSDIFNIK